LQNRFGRNLHIKPNFDTFNFVTYFYLIPVALIYLKIQDLLSIGNTQIN
jgi:hypothetical protein